MILGEKKEGGSNPCGGGKVSMSIDRRKEISIYTYLMPFNVVENIKPNSGGITTHQLGQST